MKAGKSRAVPTSPKQSVMTPPEFMAAVKARFGPVEFDLAADENNNQAFYYFNEELNALSRDWPKFGWNWLNPPYRDITPWARKCAEQSELGARILMLVPASCDSVWYGQYVQGQADVLFLRPRIAFVGYEGSSSDRPHMLCVYDRETLRTRPPVCAQWVWREPKRGSRS